MFPFFSNFSIGYLTGLAGFLPAIAFACLFKGMGRKFYGSLMGFAGGLLIAFICFEMLSYAFIYRNVYVVTAGILAGIAASALLEGRIVKYSQNIRLNDSGNYIKFALLLAFGIAMHNIPEGIALGSVMTISPETGYKMAVIIAIHCFPEGIAFTLPLVKSNAKLKTIIFFSLFLSLPMAVGSGLSTIINTVFPVFSNLFLSAASGVMIYITCGEVLPGSNKLWNGRLTTIFACLGFIAGVIITAKL